MDWMTSKLKYSDIYMQLTLYGNNLLENQIK